MISNCADWRLKMQWLVVSDPSQNVLRINEWLEHYGPSVWANRFRLGRSVPRFVCAAVRMLRPRERGKRPGACYHIYCVIIIGMCTEPRDPHCNEAKRFNSEVTEKRRGHRETVDMGGFGGALSYAVTKAGWAG